MKQPDLGLKIIELRQNKGLTQEEVVKQCNISVRTLQRIESGEVVPRGYTLKLISKALDFSFFDLSQNDSINQNSKASKSLKWKHFLDKLKDLFNLKTNTMRKLTILSLPVILVVILFFATSLDVSAKKVRKKDLIGTWQLCNSDSTAATNLYDKGFIRYKIITNESFMVTEILKGKKEIHATFWGSCSLEKNTYTEFIQYTNSNWRNVFGEENSYEIYIKDDLLFIKGTNNPYQEIWMKVKD